MSFNPNIIVFGVGGAGCNAVNNMVEKKLQGVQFVAANTDMQSLIHSNADVKIQLGTTLTQGLGAGGNPEIGREAARENIVEIKETLKNCNMLFITAGMGGGTGTGAAPLIAKIAKEMGVLTIGVITKPFSFEGRKKMDIALDGIRAMKDQVGTLIIVPNQNLMSLANEKTTNREAFLLADQVLYNGVAGISDIIVRPGHINLDLADLRGVMAEMGRAVLGTGEATGKDRASVAAERAVQNPLLENTDISGAKQLLINISGGEDLTLFETEKAIAIIATAAGDNCNIHIGSSTDESLNGKIRVSLVATGIKGEGASAVSQLLKPFQGDKNAEHLAAIKHTSLNPLHNPLRPQEIDDEVEDAEHDAMVAPTLSPAGATMAGFGPGVIDRSGANGGRPIFNNPFANAAAQEEIAQQDVEKDNDEMAKTAANSMANHGDDAMNSSDPTDPVAHEMEDFDNFSKRINANNDVGDDDATEEDNDMATGELGADRLAAYRQHDTADEHENEMGDEAMTKKPGLFKKMFSAFFGGQEDGDGNQADNERLSANRLLSEQDMGDEYPEVVDLRGENHATRNRGDDAGDQQKMKRRISRKKHSEEEIDSDLFSMPRVE